ENITGRKRAEEQLQNIIRELQTILENVPVMISFKDMDNRYVKVNPAVARIIGRPVQEIEGKTFSELYPGAPDNFSLTDQEVILSKTPKLGILEELTTSKGEHIWVQTDTVPLFNESGEAIGVIVVSTDVTERKLDKDAISLVNHKLNLLSGITRHDIGNELQVIFGYAGLALDQNLDPRVREYINNVDVSAHHIERQISFTRDYQDIGVHTPIWQDVRIVITHAITSIDVTPIQVFSEVKGIEMYADPLIVKVFFNLIDNAKRYGDTISKIRFYGVEGKEGYIIICEDDGVGIPNEFKSKIFNREYYKHTGFGLNLSREILDITGITITETGEPGKGARFEIQVPKGKWRLVE
ncbi:MAG: PAS domain-containing protein, partial [Methanospirillum sp.]|uniref:PAS domain-containing protein n=1 Tax=Methanospirillum sp. TaxID=45200 RepID=UPI0023690C6D